jgi:hypothetical protein
LGSQSGAGEVKQAKWFGKINWGLLRHTRPPVSFLWLVINLFVPEKHCTAFVEQSQSSAYFFLSCFFDSID